MISRFIHLGLLLTFVLAGATAYSVTGSMFDETFNQAASPEVACSTNISTTACEQFWDTTSGSGESLTASSCTGSWNFSNQLKLPHGSTAPVEDTWGSIPYTSNTATLDIYFEYCYTSTTVTGFRKFVDFRNRSGSSLFYIEQSSSGSGSVFYNGGTSHSLSANARHIIHYHNQTGACSADIDGGSSTSLTCVANDLNEIILTGDTGTSAADIYFGQIYINYSSSPCAQTFPPNSVVDFAGLSNGVTVTNSTLASSAHWLANGTSYDPPAYTAGSGSDVMEGSTSFTPTFPSGAKVCGTSYTNNTGFSLQHHVPVGAPGAFVSYPLISNNNLKVVGFYYTPSSSNASATAFVDQGNIVGSTYWHICTNTTSTGTGCSGTGSFFDFCSESTSGAYNCIAITNSSTYWVSMSCTPSGTGDGMNLYNVNGNGSAGSLIVSWSINNSGCALDGGKLQFGAVGSENAGVTYDSYYAFALICVTQCTFPLLPPLGIVNMPPLVASDLDPKRGRFTNGTIEQKLRWVNP